MYDYFTKAARIGFIFPGQGVASLITCRLAVGIHECGTAFLLHVS